MGTKQQKNRIGEGVKGRSDHQQAKLQGPEKQALQGEKRQTSGGP